jgi:hypothetical protein
MKRQLCLILAGLVLLPSIAGAEPLQRVTVPAGAGVVVPPRGQMGALPAMPEPAAPALEGSEAEAPGSVLGLGAPLPLLPLAAAAAALAVAAGGGSLPGSGGGGGAGGAPAATR